MRIVEIGNPKFQRSDFVGVLFYDSSLGLMQRDHHLYWHALCSLRQLPLKVGEWHICHDGFFIDTALPILSYCYGKKDETNSLHLHKGTWRRWRWDRWYYYIIQQVQFSFREKGSRTECAYSLMKSGLPARELPLTEDGSVELKYHEKWLNENCDIGNLKDERWWVFYKDFPVTPLRSGIVVTYTWLIVNLLRQRRLVDAWTTLVKISMRGAFHFRLHACVEETPAD